MTLFKFLSPFIP